MSRTYNNDLRLESLSVNGACINLGYDADSLLTQAGSLTLTNDPQDGNLTGTTLGNESETFTYNDFGELTTSSADYGATVLLRETYFRDQLGRITQKVETSAGVATTFNYTYDPAGHLTQVQQNSATTATYTYDSNNNRTSVNQGGGVTTGSCDDQDRLTQYGETTYSYSANREVLIQKVNGQTTIYNYDELGNLFRGRLAPVL